MCIRRNSIIRLFALLLILIRWDSLTEAQVVEEWVTRYSGPGYNVDSPTDLTVDDYGNFYVTGYSEGSYLNYTDYLTVKYDPAGIQLWEARYNGLQNHNDEANSLAVDAFGNVIVTGKSMNGNYDIVTVKYDADGNEQWVASYNGYGNHDDIGYSVAVDANCNVIVSGSCLTNDWNEDYVTLKYSPNGEELWQVLYNYQGNNDDCPTDMVVDSDNNIYVVGTSVSGYWNYDYATVKYDSSGNEIWVTRYNGTGDDWDEPHALSVDLNGNVYITGFSLGPNSVDIVTIKYDCDGAEQWVAQYDGLGNSIDIAHDLAIDPECNVYVTGQSQGTSWPILNINYVTIKYSTDGQQQWASVYDSPLAGENIAHSIAVDTDGDAYVTGGSQWDGLDLACATIKYNSAGVQQWIIHYQYSSTTNERGHKIVLDNEGYICVTGESGIDISSDYFTAKYSQFTPEVVLILSSTGFTTFPPSGGVLEYNISGSNNSVHQIILDIWVDATLPDSSVFGPVLGPVQDFTMPAGFSTDRDRELTIPSGAPAGNYSLNGYLGIYDEVNPTVYAEDHFNFFKEGVSDQGLSDWFTDSGVEFTTEQSIVSSDLLLSSFHLHPSHPNPFNPSTTLSFDLPSACRVELRVYDVTGRQVAALLDGWRESGTHTVTFDASNLPSGIYIARLEAGDYQASQKLVLLK